LPLLAIAFTMLLPFSTGRAAVSDRAPSVELLLVSGREGGWRKGGLSGPAYIGEPYALALQIANPEEATELAQRYLYAFWLDPRGNSVVLFPPQGDKASPPRVRIDAGHGPWPRRIPLGLPFGLGPPLGTHSFVLVTTPVPLVALDKLQRLSGSVPSGASPAAATVRTDAFLADLLAAMPPGAAPTVETLQIEVRYGRR
jgi:hypothetical protein